MARADWPREARDPGPFSQALKCCTFEPFIPNFTIGRLLKEPSTAIPLQRAIARGRLSPLGLLPRTESSDDFGRNVSDRCSFLNDRASCTIWPDRPSVCRSYFCVSDQGEKGQAIWKRAETLGNEAEWQLAHEVLWDLGFTQTEIAAGTFAEWSGRELSLFLEISKRAFDDNQAERLSSRS